MYYALTWKDEGSRTRFTRWPGSRSDSREQVLRLLYDILITDRPHEILPDGTYRVQCSNHGCHWVTLYRIREVRR